MNPLELIVNVSDDVWQTSLHCPELLFPDQDPSESPPASVSPWLDELNDLFPIQSAAGAGDVDFSNRTISASDDSLAGEWLTDGFHGCLTDSFKCCFANFNDCFTDDFNGFFADGLNKDFFSNSSAVELPSQSDQAAVDYSLLCSGDREADDFSQFIRWDTEDSSASSFTESASTTSGTDVQSPTGSLEQCQSGDEISPGWSPQELLSVHDVGRIMDEDGQRQTGKRAPSPDISKKDDDDDVVFLYERTVGRRKRQQKSRQHHSRPLGRRLSSDSSQCLAPGAPGKSKNRSNAHGWSTTPAADSRRWKNEWFRLEKIGIHESGGQSLSEYTWMGPKRGWGNGREAKGLADVSRLSYVVVRRGLGGYGIKAMWDEEITMFSGEDGMTNKKVRLSRSMVQKLLTEPCKSIKMSESG